ncbi:MAG: penicillin-binding protein, partial [Bacteroidetes bacterium]
MKLKRAWISLLLGLMALPLPAQIGGRHVYDFMNLTPSARILSLGGVNVSTMDEDVNFALQNPALMTEEMHKRVSLSFSSYLAGIRYGYAGYSHTFDKVGTFHSGIHYMNSGEMQGADEYGNLTNPFYANELLWVVGYSRAYRGFQYGGNLKVISSTLAPGFHSAG